MNQLSKEAIEAIDKINPLSLPENRSMYHNGAYEALTNPEIYEKACLISLEDAMGFAEWVSQSEYFFKKNLWYSISEDKDAITTAQLFQIYKQQK